jgi:hypothetical protein
LCIDADESGFALVQAIASLADGACSGVVFGAVATAFDDGARKACFAWWKGTFWGACSGDARVFVTEVACAAVGVCATEADAL